MFSDLTVKIAKSLGALVFRCFLNNLLFSKMIDRHFPMLLLMFKIIPKRSPHPKYFKLLMYYQKLKKRFDWVHTIANSSFTLIIEISIIYCRRCLADKLLLHFKWSFYEYLIVSLFGKDINTQHICSTRLINFYFVNSYKWLWSW